MTQPAPAPVGAVDHDRPRPLLIGEAPSRTGDRFHRFPLSGSPARVLCSASGIPPKPDTEGPGRWTWALYDRFECRNLFERYADATPWSAPGARRQAEHLRDGMHDRVVVGLGRRVHLAVLAALGVPVLRSGAQPAASGFGGWHVWAAPWTCTTISGGPWVVGVPHPSGLNRLLNDAAERERVGQTLREAQDRAATVGRS